MGPRVPNYSPRFDRVLLLSAMPLESDYEQLWRQLDLFGFGQSVKDLCDPELKTPEKKEIASGFLVRRLTGLRIGGELHTKNMYRREWRGGGCDQHDDPLEVPDDRQRLIVALVQKKVAEVLQEERFGASFQMGMLASFESFFRTAKVKKDDDSNFDAAEQTDSELEKEGIDRLRHATPAINKLSDSYWREFGEALPHPEMAQDGQSCRKPVWRGRRGPGSPRGTWSEAPAQSWQASAPYRVGDQAGVEHPSFARQIRAK